MKNKIVCLAAQGVTAIVAWKLLSKTIGERPTGHYPNLTRVVAVASLSAGLLFADAAIERKLKVENLDLFA
jgi:hypothetical protein